MITKLEFLFQNMHNTCDSTQLSLIANKMMWVLHIPIHKSGLKTEHTHIKLGVLTCTSKLVACLLIHAKI